MRYFDGKFIRLDAGTEIAKRMDMFLKGFGSRESRRELINFVECSGSVKTYTEEEIEAYKRNKEGA